LEGIKRLYYVGVDDSDKKKWARETGGKYLDAPTKDYRENW
jgi:hypothetical protein